MSPKDILWCKLTNFRLRREDNEFPVVFQIDKGKIQPVIGGMDFIIMSDFTTRFTQTNCGKTPGTKSEASYLDD